MISIFDPLTGKSVEISIPQGEYSILLCYMVSCNKPKKRNTSVLNFFGRNKMCLKGKSCVFEGYKFSITLDQDIFFYQTGRTVAQNVAEIQAQVRSKSLAVRSLLQLQLEKHKNVRLKRVFIICISC